MKKKLLTSILVTFLALSLTACADSEKEPEPEKSAKSTEKVDKPTADAEPNTSAKVDEILLKAIEDAKSMSENEATQKWEEAFDYLKSHSENFYENNEVMEQSMYYGEFIYQYIETNSNASDVSQLEDSTRAAYDAGYNTVKAIKYVYRNAATPDDPDTVSALQEAKDALSKFK